MLHTTKNEAPAGDVARIKRQAVLRAGLARKGCALHRLPDGAWLICRWDRSCTLADVDAVGAFLRRAGGTEQ